MPHALMLPGKVLPLPTWEEIPQVTTPIDVGGLVDSLFRVSIGNPQRGTLEGPITNAVHEANELDVGPQ